MDETYTYDKMQGNELMSYYVMMNDFDSSLMPRNLQAIIDDKKQNNENWSYEASRHSFPYYIENQSCPENIFLLCDKNVGALKFHYYKKDYGHLMSRELFALISEFKCSDFYHRSITATSIKDGAIIRDYLKYLYFKGDDLLDEKKSRLEEDKFGDYIPHDIVFNPNVKEYDIFSIRETLLGGFIFVKEDVKNSIENKGLKGIKFVMLKDAMGVYSKDYFYEFELNRKKTIRKLP